MGITEIAIGGVVFVFISVLLIWSGVDQIKSSKPAIFFAREQFDEKLIDDVKAWNKTHGQMWIAYGVIMLVCVSASLYAMVTLKSLLCLIPMALGIIVPPFRMMKKHKKMVLEHYKGKND